MRIRASLAPPLPSRDFLEGCRVLMSGRSVKQVIEQALLVLLDERRLARGCLASNLCGRPVRPEDPDAVCWSIEGALAMSCNPHGILPPFFIKLLEEAAREQYGCSVAQLNDGLTHGALIHFLEQLIERAKRERYDADCG